VFQPDNISEHFGRSVEPGLQVSPIGVPTSGHITNRVGYLYQLTTKRGARFQQNNIELNVFAFEGRTHSGGTTPNDYNVVLPVSHSARQIYRVRGRTEVYAGWPG
jgi:hypothetical protein